MKRAFGVFLCFALLLSAISCTPQAPQQAAPPSLAPTATASPVTEITDDSQFAPGKYTAESSGFGGVLKLEVEVDEKNILAINVLENAETPGIGSVALEKLPGTVVEKQSLDIDGITGATITSTAFLKALEAGLLQATDDISFLKSGASAGQAAAGSAVTQMEADVVVVGAGLSGLCATLSAAENGAKVILLEKLSMTGGSAKTSLGAFMVCEVEENKDFHVTEEKDTLDAARDRWIKNQVKSFKESQYPDMARVDFMLIQTMHTIGWLKQWATFKPRNTIAERGMALVQVDVPEITGDAPPAGKLLQKLTQASVGKGVELMLETRATELIMDGDKVVGVKASSAKGDYEISCKNVILASGGFSESDELLQKYLPELGTINTTGSSGNTGDGIVMALAAGAAMFEDAWILPTWPGPTAEFKAATPYATIFMEYSSPLDFSESSYFRLMVDKDGKRFMNEASHYSDQDNTMVLKKNGPYWSLYSNLRQEAADIAELGLPTGKVVKGNTIKELAAAAGMDPAALQDTVGRYNEMAKTGKDTDFNKPADYLSAIEEGPYYLIQILPSACDTMSGVKTNFEQQALRADGSVIKGLYAVGSMSNRQYYNQMYYSGSALTFSSSAGRIAGAHAAGN